MKTSNPSPGARLKRLALFGAVFTTGAGLMKLTEYIFSWDPAALIVPTTMERFLLNIDASAQTALKLVDTGETGPRDKSSS